MNKKLLKKFINQSLINNFWEYITLIFTHYYGDKFTSADERREQTEDSLKKIFEKLIFEAYINEGIIKIPFKSLRIEYIDVYDPSIMKNQEKEKKK